MKPYHQVEEIKFSDDLMTIKIDGILHTFPLVKVSQRLKLASKSDRENFIVSSSGYGIHWPAIDEDLSIDGLLGIKHLPSFVKKVAS
jgi:hypothetical protein